MTPTAIMGLLERLAALPTDVGIDRPKLSSALQKAMLHALSYADGPLPEPAPESDPAPEPGHVQPADLEAALQHSRLGMRPKFLIQRFLAVSHIRGSLVLEPRASMPFKTFLKAYQAHENVVKNTRYICHFGLAGMKRWTDALRLGTRYDSESRTVYGVRLPHPPVTAAEAAALNNNNPKAAKALFLYSAGSDGDVHMWADGKKAEYRSHNAAAADLKKRGYYGVHPKTVSRAFASRTKRLQALNTQGMHTFWVVPCDSAGIV